MIEWSSPGIAQGNSPGLIYPVWVDPRQFGLKTSNTAAQNTTAFQAAINYANTLAQGAAVVVPPGIWAVQKAGPISINGGTNNSNCCLLLPSTVSLIGFGRSSVLFNAGQQITHSATDICDNIIVCQGSYLTVENLFLLGNALSTDPVLTGLHDAYGSGQGGYGIVVAGASAAAPTNVSIKGIFCSSMRGGAINLGGENITAFNQVLQDFSVDDISVFNYSGNAIRCYAGVFGGISNIHGSSCGSGLDFVLGPFNHIGTANVDLINASVAAGTQFGVRIYNNNTIQDTTDLEFVNCSIAPSTTGFAAGIIVQSDNAASNIDGIKISNSSCELKQTTGTGTDGISILSGASLVVAMEINNCSIRSAHRYGVYSEQPNGCRLLMSNVSSESNGSYGYYFNGAGFFQQVSSESHGNTNGVGVFSSAEVRMSACMHHNIGGSGTQVVVSSGKCVAHNCNFTGVSTTNGVNITAGQVAVFSDCDMTGNGVSSANARIGTFDASVFRNCQGINNVGLVNLNSGTSAINPAMGAGGGGSTGQPVTATAYKNVSGADMELFVNAAGTCTAVLVTGHTSMTTGGTVYGMRIRVPAGESVTFTVGGAPSPPTLLGYVQ